MNYLFLFLFNILFVFQVKSQNTDINILRNINNNRNVKYDNTFKNISSSVYPISISTPIVIYCFGKIKHDSLIKEKGVYIAASLIMAAGITYGLKHVVNRDRPYITYSFIENVAIEKSKSFPSGHTSDAFSTATSVSLAFRKWYVITPSFLWACSVGYSRMHLGVHYPSDVIGGAVVGSGSAYLCYKANQWLRKRQNQRG